MMEELIDAPETTLTAAANLCPVCDRLADELFTLASVPEELGSIIKPNAATPGPEQVCSRCIDLFTRALRQIESQSAIFEQNDFVLPTPLRMDADERFTGRGVTMAFLDSGFYAHDDLTKPENRIVAYRSIFDGED